MKHYHHSSIFTVNPYCHPQPRQKVSVQQPHIRDSREVKKRSLLEVNEHFCSTDNKVDGVAERLRQKEEEKQSVYLIHKHFPSTKTQHQRYDKRLQGINTQNPYKISVLCSDFLPHFALTIKQKFKEYCKRLQFLLLLISFLIYPILSHIQTNLSAEESSRGVNSSKDDSLQTLHENNALAEKIYSNILSPYCPGLTLKDCPSTQAKNLKDRIKENIDGGMGEADINTLLQNEFGDTIFAMPGVKGFNLLAWIVPGFFLFGGIVFLIIWLKRQKK
jgi:cytochrome c-type biogenesis protein CcmH/NrfF